MGSAWVDKAQEREGGFTPVMYVTRLLNLCQRLTSTKFGSILSMCLFARVVARSSTIPTASTDKRSLCVASLTTGRAFATYPCGATTTIEEIILNLNVSGEVCRSKHIIKTRISFKEHMKKDVHLLAPNLQVLRAGL